MEEKSEYEPEPLMTIDELKAEIGAIDDTTQYEDEDRREGALVLAAEQFRGDPSYSAEKIVIAAQIFEDYIKGK